jgi:putative exosortase-associated protein (TIGR04073 family)
MSYKLSLLAAVALAGLFSTGCANTEKKLGRGMRNSFEIVRLGEMRREMEQSAFTDGPEVSYTTGFIRGLDRTLARTGIGLYEIVTAPIPPYHPICTDHFAPEPVYPDNCVPNLVQDPLYASDTHIGFGGGDIAPFVPGSRFSVFETH